MNWTCNSEKDCPARDRCFYWVPKDSRLCKAKIAGQALEDLKKTIADEVERTGGRLLKFLKRIFLNGK